MPRSPSGVSLSAYPLFIFLFLGSCDLYAQLLSNTQFDTDVSGWTASPPTTIDWDPLDVDASLVSGSALVTNFSDTVGDSTGARQCASGISEAITYEVGARIYIPGSQTETGRADILVQWYSDMSCTDFISTASSSSVQTTTPDEWLPVSGLLQAPAGCQSARVRLSVRKEEDSGSLAAHFDNVIFVSTLIFADGFESGDTSAWSYQKSCPGPLNPNACFSFSALGLTVQFANQSTGDQPISYLWDFDDGTTPPYRFDANPQHTYPVAATYKVKLTVTNAMGLDTIVKPVTVDF